MAAPLLVTLRLCLLGREYDALPVDLRPVDLARLTEYVLKLLCMAAR